MTAAEADVKSAMLVQVASKRPDLARRLARTALSPREIAATLKAIEGQEAGTGCEFARAFPDLAARALAEAAQPTEDEELAAYLARMRRLDEELVTEERELGRRLRARGR